MLGRLILMGVLVLPLIEIALFVVVGQAIGVIPTLGLVLLGAIAGSLVIRWQGVSALREVQGAMQSGALPGRKVGDRMLAGLGGLLLLVPGFFTDAIGLLLLVPPVRGLIYRTLGRFVRVVDIGGVAPVTDPHLVELDDGQWRER